MSAAPAEVSDGDVVEVAFQHTSSIGRPQVVVRHWQCAAPPGSSCDPRDFVSDVVTDWWLTVRNLLSVQASYSGARWRTVLPVYSDDEDLAFGPAAGLSAGDAMPPQVSGCLYLECGDTPGVKEGRLYTPQCSETRNGSDGVPLPGFFIACNLLASTVVSPWGPYGPGGDCSFVPVVWSRSGASVSEVTGFRVAPQWRSIRRRSGFPVLPPS